MNVILIPSTKHFCSHFLRSSNSVLLCHKPLKFSKEKLSCCKCVIFLKEETAKDELRYKLFIASIYHRSCSWIKSCQIDKALKARC